MKQIHFDWDNDESAAETQHRFPNEVIRASAGTGKTFQLSNRYIALAQASDRPDEILAATFARKAAGEILDRVVLRLAEAAGDAKKLQELRGFLQAQNPHEAFEAADCLDLLAKLIRNLHRLRISTLDSFFVQIAGSFGLELGLPPGWSIVEEVIDQRLRALAIQEVLDEDNISDLLTLLHLLSKGDITRAVSEQIRRTANDLYNLYRETTPGNANGEMPAVWKSIKRYKQLDEADWEQALSALAMLEFEDKRFQNACTRDLELASESDWEKLVAGGFIGALLQGKDTFHSKPIPPEVVAVYAPIIEHVKSQLVNRIADQTEATWKVLDRFHQAYQHLKNDQRAFRFQDITQMLAATMSEMDSDQMAFRLDANVGHLLLDEFQDTSLLQWTVIQPFAQTSARDPRYSFFCVGDVKQAIYGWRGGVADLFSTLDKELENLTERELTCSFRSSQVVIDVVNRVFAQLDKNEILPRLPGVAEVWSKRFQTHTTARDLPGYCVLQTAKFADEDESQQTETLSFAAAEVARLHREIPEASIGILVRKNQAVARIIYELRHTHGLEASEEGGNPLLDSAAVQLVLSLLAIADHPGDTIARFHVAHSALGSIMGFTDYERADIAQRLSSEIRASLLHKGYGATIANWVRELTPFCNERELSRLMQLVSLAYRYEAQATEQAKDFIETVSVMKVEDPSSANVRVMNIHQSKGLQFDIVVLPELDGPLSGLTPPVIVGRPKPTAPVEAVFRYIPSKVLPLLPDRFNAMLEQHNQQLHNESLCLLYVAMTRAVYALHLIIAPSKENERTIPKTYAGILRSAFQGKTVQNPPAEILYQHGNPDWHTLQFPAASQPTAKPQEPRSLSVHLKPSTASHRRRLAYQTPSELEGGPLVELPRWFREDSVLSRTRGSLWHAWMEHIGWLEDGLPDPESLIERAGQFLHPRLKIEDELKRFITALSQPEIRAALSREQYATAPEWQHIVEPTLELHHEYPIAYRESRTLTNGIVDRLVLLKQAGQVIAADIIDYKTDRLPPDNPNAMVELTEYYRPQLAAYRAAIRQLFGLAAMAVQAQLLFLTAGKVWVLPE